MHSFDTFLPPLPPRRLAKQGQALVRQVSEDHLRGRMVREMISFLLLFRFYWLVIIFDLWKYRKCRNGTYIANVDADIHKSGVI